MKKCESLIIWITTVIYFGVLLNAVEAVVVFDDGGTHTIDYTITGNSGVEVRHDFVDNEMTTVNVVAGGIIQYSGLRTYNDSQAFISGGTIGNPNWHVWAYDNSRITMTDGIVYDELGARAFSTVTMSGGTINGWLGQEETYRGYLWARENGTVNMTGGTVTGYLCAEDSGQVIMSGGFVTDALCAGKSGEVSDSVITILGSDFAINGTPVAYGEYTVADFTNGSITGILVNGDSLNTDFYIYDNSSIILAVPEPGTVLLFGLGGLFLRKRKTLR